MSLQESKLVFDAKNSYGVSVKAFYYEDVKKAVLKYRKEYIEQGFFSIEVYDLIFGFDENE